MRVLILPNFTKPRAAQVLQTVIQTLSACGIEPVLQQADAAHAPEHCKTEPFDRALETADLLLAIGGDGTILHAAKHAAAAQKPILGVNLGRLGFLAGVETEEMGLLSHLADGRYSLEKRMMLEVQHLQKGKTKVYTAFNDVVVTKGVQSRIVDLNLFCDARSVGSYRADGVIFSTPTGSTAYSLSAGGPIVDSRIECILVTPICPHSLFSRSLCFSSDQTVGVRLEEPVSDVYMTVDGEQTAPFEAGDEILVSKSSRFVQLVNLNNRTFYSALQKKFLNQAGDPV